MSESRNRLSEETSPYLLQHRNNPVHWQPWGPAAFAAARERDAPVLLSIGYSSCHWCHVMARESFENDDLARVMNHSFVPVKVDREERPDLDEIYMAFVQATTGSGGWPLTAFLSPDGTPFFGGTYFPPESRFGRPGLRQVLDGVASLWADRARRGELLQRGRRLFERMRQAAALPERLARRGELITSEPVSRAVRELLRNHDRRHGGFGGAPKFPPSSQLALLLRHHLETGNAEALAATRLTLSKMADGGIADQLGGGFHRYSTDAEWRVPHFEKMLYDNALLVPNYSLAFRISGDPGLREAARRALDWMRRELRNAGGAFGCSLDADTEGEEGRYYTWTAPEVEAVLGEDAPLFAAAHDLRPEGSREERTVLRRALPDAELAERFGVPEDSVRGTLAAARERLLAARAERVGPALDDKVLLSWNALAVSAFARAHRAFGDPDALETAQAAGRFLLGNLCAAGRYSASWRLGRARVPAMLDDHAFWIQALLDLFESDFDERWLAAAGEAADLLAAHFAAPGGGYFTTADDHEALPVRTRTGHDGALPSGNATAAEALLRLAAITGSPARREAARATLLAFLPQANESPAAFPTLLGAVLRYLAEPRQIVVVGPKRARATRRAVERLWRVPSENAVVLVADPGEDGSLPALRAAAANAKERGTDKVSFLPCRGGVCSPPLSNLEAAVDYLGS